ncbi:unnamed protein product [Paramecium primaurelia]|uniref:Uncharacterized protein n=1 Tax=Paramecium primaurelia TaxID=5886 RepID=A0A8S1KTM5_PARPR|nr:unnamed protein product [Paramecium primaurelia]
MKMFKAKIYLLWMFAYLICVKSQCDEILDQKQCNQNTQCEWVYWKPSKCQNICSLLTTENTCNFAANCKWIASSSSCFIKKCTEEQSIDRCDKIVACTQQDNKCWDSSCIQLQAKEAGKCANAYCIWDDKRQLCYDKKCSDYYNQYDCSQMSFCIWFKYKCIDNGNKKLDF